MNYTVSHLLLIWALIRWKGSLSWFHRHYWAKAGCARLRGRAEWERTEKPRRSHRHWELSLVLPSDPGPIICPVTLYFQHSSNKPNFISDSYLDLTECFCYLVVLILIPVCLSEMLIWLFSQMKTQPNTKLLPLLDNFCFEIFDLKLHVFISSPTNHGY